LFEETQVYELNGLGVFGLRISNRKITQHGLHTLYGWVGLRRNFVAVKIMRLFDDFLIVGLEVFPQ